MMLIEVIIWPCDGGADEKRPIKMDVNCQIMHVHKSLDEPFLISKQDINGFT